MKDTVDERNPEPKSGEERGPASPYGPQHGHIDEAAGGADSSPLEALSSDEREQEAERRRAQGI